MTTTVLDIARSGAALGATVQGLDLHQPLDEDHIRAIYAALVEHQVLIFPQQSLSAEDQICFGAAFGHLQVHAALDALADHPEVVVFDTHERATTAEWWHTDVTCAQKPPLGSILQMVIAPPKGGATHWASMTAAYDSLDVYMQRKLEGLTALHRSWWQPVQEAVHPVVRVHPDSGRKGIFVNGIFTKEILGIDPAEGAELLQFLIEHATRDEFTVHHEWRSGDIAFWDNRCTQHRVDNDFGDERRRGHRVTIDGDVPV